MPTNIKLAPVIQAMIQSSACRELIWLMIFTCQNAYSMVSDVKKAIMKKIPIKAIQTPADAINWPITVNLGGTIDGSNQYDILYFFIRKLKCTGKIATAVMADYISSRPKAKQIRRIVRGIKVPIDVAIIALYYGYVSVFNEIVKTYQLPVLNMPNVTHQLGPHPDTEFIWITLLINLNWSIQTIKHWMSARKRGQYRMWNWDLYFKICNVFGIPIEKQMQTIKLILRMVYHKRIDDYCTRAIRIFASDYYNDFEYAIRNGIYYDNEYKACTCCHECYDIIKNDPYEKIEDLKNDAICECSSCGDDYYSPHRVNCRFCDYNGCPRHMNLINIKFIGLK